MINNTSYDELRRLISELFDGAFKLVRLTVGDDELAEALIKNVCFEQFEDRP